MSWPAIVVLAVGAYGCKFFGVFVLARFASVGGRTETPGPSQWIPGAAALIPAALFAALIAVQTFEVEGRLELDARFAGVAVAGFAVWRRAPFVVVVVSAMAVTAAVRWQTSW
jgi:branched-subunit amino acid transport protein